MLFHCSKHPDIVTTTIMPFEYCYAGGVPEWMGNGRCNDENNHEACDWDGGDCCGEVDKSLCIHCKW